MKKIVKVGKFNIGDGNITIQSMTNTYTKDYDKTLAQIIDLKNAGCDIVRLAVCDNDEVNVCKKLLSVVDVPLVADIQFDYKLAIACSDIGFDKIRFNPGNIGSDDKVKQLVYACKQNHTPIRIGVNGGSMEKEFLDKYGVTAKGLAESALRHVHLLEKFGFDDIIISAKSSNVKTMIGAYRYLAQRTDYPLHVGVTESGSKTRGLVKSSIGIGSLLLDNIGDTIRVSLTGDPVEEVVTAKKILQAIDIDRNFCEIISCPTCSRCKYDLESIVNELEVFTANIHKKLKVAVMGCVVNGIGEGKEADFGVAGGGEGKAVIFAHGKQLKTLSMEEVLPTLKKMIEEYNE